MVLVSVEKVRPPFAPESSSLATGVAPFVDESLVRCVHQAELAVTPTRSMLSPAARPAISLWGMSPFSARNSTDGPVRLMRPCPAAEALARSSVPARSVTGPLNDVLSPLSVVMPVPRTSTDPAPDIVPAKATLLEWSKISSPWSVTLSQGRAPRPAVAEPQHAAEVDRRPAGIGVGSGEGQSLAAASDDDGKAARAIVDIPRKARTRCIVERQRCVRGAKVLYSSRASTVKIVERRRLAVEIEERIGGPRADNREGELANHLRAGGVAGQQEAAVDRERAVSGACLGSVPGVRVDGACISRRAEIKGSRRRR